MSQSAPTSLENPPPAYAAEPSAAHVPDRPDDRALEPTIRTLFTQGRNGVHWFYWVAGLSLVNSAIILGGGNIHFVVGLGITGLVDAFAAELARQTPEAAMAIKGCAFAFAVAAAAVVALFGWLSSKRIVAALVVGMVLYLLDGLLYVLMGDIKSIAFHAFALFHMWRGMQAFRQLAVIEQQLASPVSIAVQPVAPAA